MRGSSRTLLVIVWSWSVVMPGTTTAWERVVAATPKPTDSEFARDVAVDGGGDIVIGGGAAEAHGEPPFFTVLKLSGQTGRILWRTTIRGALGCGGFRVPCPDGVNHIALDRAGNVLASGVIGTGAFPSTPSGLLVKLSGATGAEIWRSAAKGGGFIVDQVGDIYAADTDVVRVAGASGAEMWRWKPDDGAVNAIAFGQGGTILAAVVRPPRAGTLVFPPSALVTVTLDVSSGAVRSSTASEVLKDFSLNALSAYGFAGEGDLIVAGPDAGMPTNVFRVARVSRSTGATIWSQGVSGTYGVVSLVIDSSGDVVVLGPQPNLNVSKLSGEMGQVKWTRTFSSTWIMGITLEPGGDVIATGGGQCKVRGGSFLHCHLQVLRLGAADGRVRWRRTLRNHGFTETSGSIVAIDGAANVVTIGYGIRRFGPDLYDYADRMIALKLRHGRTPRGRPGETRPHRGANSAPRRQRQASGS